ncbi:septation ring formation regulator EzrA [Comamonas serinivorans]|uniref:Cell division protein FtsB n=1 Tax=Comamonas serinivorans TaxID=1082851 RepID=A0A1Y0ENI9_9BURK|nr:septum formation initiator family protein [Comamonas serinivorans]ARU05177.1 septation ring formation regulator EzrA [Comamonas serinivorans]
MVNRIVFVVLISALAIILGQLWFTRGGLPTSSDLQRRLHAQLAANAKMQLANDQLASELSDLRDGLETVEEKARIELGMVKPNEILVQIAR